MSDPCPGQGSDLENLTGVVAVILHVDGALQTTSRHSEEGLTRPDRLACAPLVTHLSDLTSFKPEPRGGERDNTRLNVLPQALHWQPEDSDARFKSLLGEPRSPDGLQSFVQMKEGLSKVPAKFHSSPTTQNIAEQCQ